MNSHFLDNSRINVVLRILLFFYWFHNDTTCLTVYSNLKAQHFLAKQLKWNVGFWEFVIFGVFVHSFSTFPSHIFFSTVDYLKFWRFYSKSWLKSIKFRWSTQTQNTQHSKQTYPMQNPPYEQNTKSTSAIWIGWLLNLSHTFYFVDIIMWICIQIKVNH